MVEKKTRKQSCYADYTLSKLSDAIIALPCHPLNINNVQSKTIECRLLKEENHSYMTVTYWERLGQVADAGVLDGVMASLKFENAQ